MFAAEKRATLLRSMQTSVFARLEEEFRTRFEVIGLPAPTLTRAGDLVRVHGLRAADGIQLACALVVAARLSSDATLTLVSSDIELNAAAEKEGFEILNPQQD